MRPRRLLILLLASSAALLAVPAITGAANDPDALRQQIEGSKAKERSLGSAVARLGQLERRASRDVAALQARLDRAQAEFEAAEGRLVATQGRLRFQRARLERLRKKLAERRAQLADVLRTRYIAQQPDIVDVVVQSDGFQTLLERINFLRRVQDNDKRIVSSVRDARTEAAKLTASYTKLEREQQEETLVVARERDALAGKRDALARRQQALAQARSARQAALRNTRAGRAQAQKTLDKLLAEQRRAATTNVGPGGPWAIPWVIVQCESGGINQPPNWATASGYYQFIIPTWKALGGSTPQAYQASKAEQDRLAAKLWDGGRGARNWDCASIVGIL